MSSPGACRGGGGAGERGIGGVILHGSMSVVEGLGIPVKPANVVRLADS
jgi:hypothetical protein